MLPIPADSFRAWAAENGIGPSGLSVADFFAAPGGNGIPKAFSYAYGENLQPGDALLELFAMDGKLFLEAPRQLPATTNGVVLSIVATTNLMDRGGWILSPAGPEPVEGDPSNRARVEVNGFSPSARLYFRLKARLLP